jgi:hypothetical protein
MKTLTYPENPSWNPLREDCHGFQVAVLVSKIVVYKIGLKAACDPENCFESRAYAKYRVLIFRTVFFCI